MRPPSTFLARSVAALVVAAVVLAVVLVVDRARTSPGPGEQRDPARAEPRAERAEGAGAADAGPVGSPTARAPFPREVLREWDARRARAWAAGDTGALTRAYTRGSVAGRRDVAALRAWRARGWRVEGLRTQVAVLRVVRRAPGSLVLLVTDRVAEPTAVRGTTVVALPRDHWDTRRLDLRRGADGRWRMAAVAPVRLGAAATLAG